MNRSRSLFTNSHDAPSPEYKYVLNAADERSQEVKAHCEDLWSDFSKHADEHFLDEFPVHFHQRWFEMYLTVSLIRAKLPVTCPKPGPDILLNLGKRRIWVEAVCATEGQLGKPDSVPPVECGKARNVPIMQYVTRIRNSLSEKERKFREYKKKGIVKCGDHQVIAVNSGAICGLFGNLDECMMRSLYGVGDMFVTFNKTSGKFGETGRRSVLTIAKFSGAEIDVQPFVNESMEHVSSVLASWANAFNRPSNLGADFVLYPNLSCSNPLLGSMLPVAEEWLFTETEDSWSGSKDRRML